MAKLYFRYGAMNCGKSTSLLQVAHNYEERGMKVVLVKPSKDKKGNLNIVSRLGAQREVNNLICEGESAISILEKYKDISCVLVDEAQFLEKRQVDELLIFAKSYDVPVICYGLRTDFKMEGFPGAIRLLEIADELEEMKTICRCGKKATVNARFVDGEMVTDGDQVAIDGFFSVTYESMCAKCYLEKTHKIKVKKK